MMVGTGIYVWRKPIPLPMKLIHARMVAQAGVIAGLVGAGLFAMLMPAAENKKSGVVNKTQFRDVVKAVPAPVAAVAAPTNQINEKQ